jgi:hypothetical protein
MNHSGEIFYELRFDVIIDVLAKDAGPGEIHERRCPQQIIHSDAPLRVLLMNISKEGHQLEDAEEITLGDILYQID